jgi:hypothetical protein
MNRRAMLGPKVTIAVRSAAAADDRVSSWDAPARVGRRSPIRCERLRRCAMIDPCNGRTVGEPGLIKPSDQSMRNLVKLAGSALVRGVAIAVPYRSSPGTRGTPTGREVQKSAITAPRA